MIFKSDLLEGIDANTEQIIWQGELIADLRERVSKLEKELSVKKAPKKVGRPRKIKSENASKQARDKDGKFAKKK